MEKKSSSYNQILKAASIFGSSQVVNILMGIVRTKLVALLLGAAGVGLISIYQSVIDLVRSLTGMGIETGAVKEIAKSSNQLVDEPIAKTISIFNRLFLFTACFGALVCIAFSLPLSLWAFYDFEHALPIALLSVAVFFVSLTTGRTAIFQGLRNISFMAKAAIAESIFTLFVIIPIYYIFGVNGIIGALICNSLVVFLCVNYFYTKLRVQQTDVTQQEVLDKGFHAFRLGIFIIVGGVISSVAMLLLRTYLLRTSGQVFTGIFQSAWAITAVFVGLILGSTGTDYFPRLCAVEGDTNKVRTLVNEQSYIVLIIAAPIVVGMLLFSKLVIYLLYSSDFTDAQQILQWQIVGAYFKILATPIATILLAKHKGFLYLISEAVFFIIYLSISYLLLPSLGVAATGIAYLVAYFVYLLVVFMMGRSLTSFGWNGSIWQMIGVNASLILAASIVSRLDTLYTIVFGILLMLITLGYSYYKLMRVFSIDELKSWFTKKK